MLRALFLPNPQKNARAYFFPRASINQEPPLMAKVPFLVVAVTATELDQSATSPLQLSLQWVTSEDAALAY